MSPSFSQNEIKLSCGDCSASLLPQGVRLVSLFYRGQEYLWQGGPPWPERGGYNIVFPAFGRIAPGGRTAYRHNGRDYQMPLHGFSRDSLFSVAKQSSTDAFFTLASNEATRSFYPFAFRTDVTSTLDTTSLSVDYAVTNTDETDILFALGTHFAVKLPLPGAQEGRDHALIFEKEETSLIRLPRGGGFDNKLYPSPVRDRHLALTTDLFSGDGVFFINDPENNNRLSHPTILSSPSFVLAGAAPVRLKMAWHGFENFGFWSKPLTQEFPKPSFLCFEPYSGNTGGPFTPLKDNRLPTLDEIPGLVRLRPGKTFRAGYKITFLSP